MAVTVLMVIACGVHAEAQGTAGERPAWSELFPHAVAVWNFDETQGDAEIKDASGNENHGSIEGPVVRRRTEVPAAQGGCLQFGGDGEVTVDLRDPTFEQKSFTIALWVYRERTDATEHLVRQANPFAGGSTGLDLRFSPGGGFGSYISGEGVGGVLLARANIDPGAWHHVVQVFGYNGIDWSDSELYVDGRLVAICDTPFGGAIQSDAPLIMGRDFKGRLARVALFGAALSAAQIESLYNEGRPHVDPDLGKE
jgi:hypothetical protein